MSLLTAEERRVIEKNYRVKPLGYRVWSCGYVGNGRHTIKPVTEWFSSYSKAKKWIREYRIIPFGTSNGYLISSSDNTSFVRNRFGF